MGRHHQKRLQAQKRKQTEFRPTSTRPTATRTETKTHNAPSCARQTWQLHKEMLCRVSSAQARQSGGLHTRTHKHPHPHPHPHAHPDTHPHAHARTQACPSVRRETSGPGVGSRPVLGPDLLPQGHAPRHGWRERYFGSLAATNKLIPSELQPIWVILHGSQEVGSCWMRHTQDCPLQPV